MDLQIIEGLLEDMNQQTNKLIDLVRVLRKGEVFGEPLISTQIDSIKNRLKSKADSLKTIAGEIKTLISQRGSQ